MKIAVCGKGSISKKFIAGCPAGDFSKQGHPVLAIDADSNPNLALTLGLTHEESSRILPADAGIEGIPIRNEDSVAVHAVTEPVGALQHPAGRAKE